MSTKKFNAENLYAIADTHFGHEGILQHREREGFFFKNTDEMDEYLINQWNHKISNKDTVLFLGDFALCNKSKTEHILSQLNGKIWFIWGNHDHKKDIIEKYSQGCYDILHIKVIEKGFDPQFIMLCHYPMQAWNQMIYGAWHLHGHSHGNLTDRLPRSLDVGWDNFPSGPLSYKAIKNILRLDREIENVDHHKPITV